jgi:hypothetical protein
MPSFCSIASRPAAVVGHLVVLGRPQVADQRGGLVHRVALGAGAAGQHHRDPRLVDQDRVGLVDDRGGELALHPGLDVGGELVAQVVEAGLADRHVRDVGAVRGAALLGCGRLGDPADAEAEQREHRLHPGGVAAGQVVVDGEHVHRAAAHPHVPERGDGGGQRLALTGGHLGDLGVQQRHRADQLHVERPLVDRAAGRLPADRADLHRIACLLRRRGQRGVVQLAQRVLTGRDGRQPLLERREIHRRARTLQKLAEPALQPRRHTHGAQRYLMYL